MKRASATIFAIAIGALASASRCEPDPPPAAQGTSTSDPAVSQAELDRVPGERATGSEAPIDARQLALAELSSRLDRVQIARGDEKVVSGGGIALEPLLGMTRSELRSALGAPHTCDKGAIAPCQTEDDWFYSFYYLPEGVLGGGPELLLQFDDRGTCVGARWLVTQ